MIYIPPIVKANFIAFTISNIFVAYCDTLQLMQDSIVRTIVINASIERVYQAVIEDFFKAWEGELSADTHGTFNFGEWGKTSGHLIDVRPPTYISYRWVPGKFFEGDIYQEGATLVEFQLTETGDATTLTLTESGFAAIPAEWYEEAMKNNTAGWDEELAKFAQLFQG